MKNSKSAGGYKAAGTKPEGKSSKGMPPGATKKAAPRSTSGGGKMGSKKGC